MAVPQSSPNGGPGTFVSLAGPKILLEGPSGTGKTRALGTLVDWADAHGMESFGLFTENGLETLLGYWLDHGRKVPDSLHWHVSTVQAIPLAGLIDAAKKVGQLSYESITKIQDTNRAANNPYEKILMSMADFPDDRTGQKFGNIGEWGTDRVLFLDSLSELANACMKMVIGNKPTASQPDYGVAQNNLMNLLRYFTQGFKPTFVMTAHVQRQVNEVTGGMQLMTRAIGKAMADDIPQLFSETIYSVREGGNWYWDTAASGVDVKTRYLPIASKIKPDFAQIMDKWLLRSKV